MVKSKQLKIKVRVQIEILFQEFYSQRQIASKLKISKYDVQYSLQIQSETGTNINGKRAGVPKVTNATEDKHLIIESKRYRRKTAPELTAKLNSSQEPPMLLSAVKIDLNQCGSGVV